MDKEVEELIKSKNPDAIALAIADYGTRIGMAKLELEKCQEAFNALIKASIELKKEQKNNNTFEQEVDKQVDRSMPSMLRHFGATGNVVTPEEHKTMHGIDPAAAQYQDRSMPSTLRHFGSYDDSYQEQPEEHKSVLR